MDAPLTGHCTCGDVAYRLAATPMIVHACHCTWCQRETGSAFALNGVVEGWAVEITRGAVEEIDTPSASGKGQTIARCPRCKVALWSHYAGAGRKLAFVRMGTLDDTSTVAPDVHIFTSTAQPWVVFPQGARVYPEYYRRSEVWTDAALARRKAALEGRWTTR